MLVPVEEVRKLAEGILLANGVPAPHARTQAGLFIEAEMRAIPSHGLLRLRRVIERIHAGLSVPGTTGKQDWTARNFLSVDGMRGLGPVVAMAALEAIIPRAKEDGIAIAAIRNTNHLGALAYYAEHVASLGLTCISLTISEALVHPYGGRKAMIGTNPIAIGVPASPHPMVLDMATGLVSMGKIYDHANRGAPIPLGWALDENGDPTTDAAAAKKGAIAPFGGAKGYALGIAFEVLVASLAASAIGTEVKGTLDSVNVSNKGDLFIVIAPPHAEGAKALVSEYLNDIRGAAPADPAHPVLAPGDRARKVASQSEKRGVYLDDGLWADLQKLAAESKGKNLMTPLFGALRLPASVVFGSGQRAAIGMITAGIGKRALICTDARLGSDAQFQAIVADIQANGVETKVYDRTEADLPIGGISGCVEECADFKPDVVLGIGGGSCMDMAKCVAVLLAHGGSLRDYYGENKIPGPVAPVIAVPTTSGTGSEVTPVAVIADTERGTKVGISSPYLIPRVAVCDPEMTLSCPPSLTAVSGADALTHAIESFTAARRTVTPDLTVKNVFVGKNVLSDTFGLLALQNIFKALRAAVKDGRNIQAREQMMLASLAAGCAFGAAGTAAAHAIQYPVGNETHTPHGMGVALLMPYVMEFNRPNCVAAFGEIGRAIGLSGSDEDLSRRLIDEVASLLKDIGIPVTLKDLGLPEDKQDWTAESAIGAARLVNNNPRLLDLDALKAITRAAYSGDRAALAS